MTACILLRQSTSVHMVTDSASYEEDGRIVSLRHPKVVTIPTLNCAICVRGWAKDGAVLADHIASRFDSFDELERNGEARIPTIYNVIAEHFHDGDACCDLSIIGWSNTRGARAYRINLQTEGSTKRAQIIAQSADVEYKPDVLREVEISGVPPAALMERFGFNLPKSADAVTINHLVHLMQIMRQDRINSRVWVGGKVTLTSINCVEGVPAIVQGIIHEWAEDRAGEYIDPAPVDWSRFDEAQLTRQQRRALARKMH